MAMFARMPVLEVARYQVRRLQHVPAVGEIFRLAERATPMHTLLTLTEVEGGAGGAGGAGAKGGEKGGAGGSVATVTKGAKKALKGKSVEPPAAENRRRLFKTLPPRLTRLTGE